MNNERLNQQAIADMLNISQSTVTKVLNHDPTYRVSDDTRELILKTAKEVGYQPRRRRTGNIAFVMANEMTLPNYEFLRALCEEAARMQRRVYLVNTGTMPSYEEISLMANPLTADGVIISGELSVRVLSRLSEIMPTVAMEMYSPADVGINLSAASSGPYGMPVDVVRADMSALTTMLVEHMIECGHRDIAMMAYSFSSMAGRLAIEGYRYALEQAKIKYDPSLVWERRGREYPDLIMDILGHPRKPTVIYGGTTTEHVAIISTLQALGKRVPDDISYVGWSCPKAFRSEYSALPEITGFDGFFQNIAQTAMHRIVDRIENKSMPVEDIVVSLNIQVGKSCQKPGNI